MKFLALLAALANAQANEVAPALQLLGQADAPDASYAGGTAATSALILMIAAAETAARPARDRCATWAAGLHGRRTIRHAASASRQAPATTCTRCGAHRTPCITSASENDSFISTITGGSSPRRAIRALP